VLHLLSVLGRANPVAFDIVEVCPPFDHSGITALLAAEIGAELLYQYSQAHGDHPARRHITGSAGTSVAGAARSTNGSPIPADQKGTP
jgi:hypothetical protein